MTATDISPDPRSSAPVRAGGSRVVLAFASLLLAAGAVLYAGAAARLVWPDAGSDVAFLAYGRLLPSATGLVLGWLLLAAVGAAWYLIPRSGGSRVDGRLMTVGTLLVAAGAVAGVVGVAAGAGEGGRYLEGPWWSDVALAAGLSVAAAAATNAARSAGDRLSIAGWYVLAALWWAAAAVVVGVLPGLEGVPAALQARFAATVLTGLVPVSAGLGALYYLAGRLVPDAVFHPRLGKIGFWSIGLSWLWLAPASLQYGPTPDWLETVPVLFAAGLIVGMLAVLGDLAHALRGRWSAVGGSRPLQFAVAGTALFAVLPFQVLLQSLRGPSTVTHFTSWETTAEILLLLGPASLWLLGLVYLVAPAGRPWPRFFGALHLWAVLAGLGTALVSLWAAGLMQGYTWAGSVNSGVGNTGDAFRNSVEPLEGLRTAAAVGLDIFALGTLAFLGVLVAALLRGRAGEEVRGEVTGTPERAVLIWQGVLLLFLVAGLSVFVLPAVDAGNEPSALAAVARPADSESSAGRGREVYAREGCWLCHTQQVRSVVTDVGLGPVSADGDYFYDPFDLLGVARIGPDLTHFASRGDLGGSVEAHLRDPRASRPWSNMPAFAYLSGDDLADLTAYLESLE